MREDGYSSENRLQKTHKSKEKNQVLKASNGTRSNVSAVLKVKSNSSWGANIVKGLTADKKVKPQTLAASRKLPLAASDASNQKISGKVKRSLVGDFPCSAANAAQVHPQAVSECNRMRSSRDLLEVEHLRILLNESKERELKLKDELAQCTETSKVADFEGKVQLLHEENERLVQRLSSVEGKNRCLYEQIASLSLDTECEDTESSSVCKGSGKNRKLLSKLEMEVVELRRVNKELQLQKRDLACKLSSAESQLASLAKMTETDLVAKAKAEASVLRHTNENLSRQVEGLQMSRLTEVEELVYLRWVNSCLRNELQNSENHRSIEVSLAPSPKSLDSKLKNFRRNIDHGRKTEVTSCGYTKSCPAKIESMKSNDSSQFLQCKNLVDKDWLEDPELVSPRQRRHSISGTKGLQVEVEVNKRRQSDGFTCLKDLESEEKASNVKETQTLLAQKYDKGATQSSGFFVNKGETNKITVLDIEKRALRIPNPPPRPSDLISSVPKNDAPSMAPVAPPPPPPPPPLPKFSSKSTNIMQRAPQVVELYHSLMRRESRKDASGGGVCDAANIVADVRSSMIGEIENRSSHLLAIKADVETQGEFVNSLIREVNNAVYRDIEDVVAFVKWLDDELCFLVDERAVLKHFDWPEKKADTLREAAFGYRDLKKLEAEISYFEDDRRLPADIALKKMVALSEKMERSVYVILRTREALIRTCKEYQIPTDWMLDTGLISKIKFASVKLAKKYMKRVAMELQSKGTSEKDPALEYMLLHGVRFAFRIHQFAGGFDSETMHGFEELRNLAHIRTRSKSHWTQHENKV